MPPIETPDVSADSSPAIEVPRNSADYAKWRQTGELPAAKPQAASTPAKETPASHEETPAPASETGTTTQEKKNKPRDTAADRLAELLDDIRQTGYTPAELKALRKQAKQELKQAEPPKTAAAEKTGNPAELKAPDKPVKKDFFEGGKFQTYDEAETAYEAAKDKYVEDLVDYKDALRQQTAQQQAAQQTVHQKMQEAKTRYGDEAIGIISTAAREISGSAEIPQAVKSILDQSPVWTDVLFTIGSKPEELAAFVDLAKRDPGAAIRKAIVVEQLVTAELAKGAKQSSADDAGTGDPAARGEDGKFKKTTPEKKESKAPPPPAEVSGRGTPPPDRAEQAFQAGDVRGAMRAMNERDLARRRGR